MRSPLIAADLALKALEEEEASSSDEDDAGLERPDFKEKLHKYSEVPIGDQLLAILSKHKVRVMDLINQWDTDGNRQVSKKEFHKAVMFMAESDEVNRADSSVIFKQFDADGQGTISFNELEKTIETFAERGEPRAPPPRPNSPVAHMALEAARGHPPTPLQTRPSRSSAQPKSRC